jgi:hypothetical protein
MSKRSLACVAWGQVKPPRTGLFNLNFQWPNVPGRPLLRRLGSSVVLRPSSEHSELCTPS